MNLEQENKLLQPIIRQFRLLWFFQIVGWTTLFLTNWKIGLAFLCIEIGNKIENNLRFESNNNTINHILSSLRSLIKRDDITEESKTIKNN